MAWLLLFPQLLRLILCKVILMAEPPLHGRNRPDLAHRPIEFYFNFRPNPSNDRIFQSAHLLSMLYTLISRRVSVGCLLHRSFLLSFRLVDEQLSKPPAIGLLGVLFGQVLAVLPVSKRFLFHKRSLFIKICQLFEALLTSIRHQVFLANWPVGLSHPSLEEALLRWLLLKVRLRRLVKVTADGRDRAVVIHFLARLCHGYRLSYISSALLGLELFLNLP